MLKPAFLAPSSFPFDTSTPYAPSSWMIATRRSLASLPSFAFAFLATKSADIRPNCRPLGCVRNTYLRLRFSSTAEEMQVVIHMNFLSFLPWANAAGVQTPPSASATATRANARRLDRWRNMTTSRIRFVLCAPLEVGPRALSRGARPFLGECLERARGLALAAHLDAGEALEHLDDRGAVLLAEASGARHLVDLLAHVGQQQRDAELLGERGLEL